MPARTRYQTVLNRAYAINSWEVPQNIDLTSAEDAIRITCRTSTGNILRKSTEKYLDVPEKVLDLVQAGMHNGYATLWWLEKVASNQGSSEVSEDGEALCSLPRLPNPCFSVPREQRNLLIRGQS